MFGKFRGFCRTRVPFKLLVKRRAFDDFDVFNYHPLLAPSVLVLPSFAAKCDRRLEINELLRKSSRASSRPAGLYACIAECGARVSARVCVYARARVRASDACAGPVRRVD